MARRLATLPATQVARVRFQSPIFLSKKSAFSLKLVQVEG
jgi:hypothetical protein